MIRWFLLCVTLISLPILTDWHVDYCFRHQHPDKNIGYTQSDRDGMDRLVDRINGEGTARKRHKRLSGSDEQAALLYLWGDGQ